MKNLIVRLTLLFIFFLNGCTQKHLSYEEALKLKLERHYAASRLQLDPYFARAGINYPPKRVAFVVFKKDRKFNLYATNDDNWHFIKSYALLGASGQLGPKRRSGDRQVPEGIYRVIALNPRSRYNLSMQLNYPNELDRKYAEMDHRTNLGGDIFIHGNKCSAGCLAIGDSAIEQLFPLVHYVGANNIIVVISPNDLRHEMPLTHAPKIAWLPHLYQQISTTLQQFPER